MIDYRDTHIMSSLERHYNEVLKFYPEEQIFALVLRGSQNYGLDTEFSDIDSRCIFIPADDDLTKEIIKENEILLDNGEQITFLDIRLFTQGLKNRSLYYLELLYSNWYIIPNKEHEALWEQYRSIANELVSCNKPAAVRSIIFYVEKKQELLFNNFYPKDYEECVRRGYSNKALYHLIRYHLLLQLLNSDEEFEKCISLELNSKAMLAKTGLMPIQNVYWLMLTLPKEIEQLAHEIINNYPINNEQCQIMDKILYEFQSKLLP